MFVLCSQPLATSTVAGRIERLSAFSLFNLRHPRVLKPATIPKGSPVDGIPGTDVFRSDCWAFLPSMSPRRAGLDVNRDNLRKDAVWYCYTAVPASDSAVEIWVLLLIAQFTLSVPVHWEDT